MTNIQKCGVIGVGFVGATCAYTLAVSGLFSDLVLVDMNRDKAIGEAADINHGVAFSKPCRVMADPAAGCVQELHPDALVDAILAKKNLGTHIADAPIVIAVGPGFTAGVDCHAAVETMRGHTLGRVLYTGSPLPNTGVPGVIGGHAAERVLRAPADGLFEPCREIGDLVETGDTIAYVAGKPMKTTIAGCLRGLLQAGVPVHEGMKSGDVDPRGKRENCDTASDKALAVGGGVLEALLHFSNVFH